MNVGLLLCDHVSLRYRDLVGDYPAMFAALLRRSTPPIRFTCFDVCAGDLPPRMDTCDAYLCTGSRFAAYEDVDWIRALHDFLRRLHENRKPFVGICFGQQCLARALGGEVRQAERGWGVGVQAIDILRQEDWMRPPRSDVRLAYMHQDQVTRLPESAQLLGRSEHCPVAMFSVGATMLGIQAHPEFPSIYSEALLRDRIENIGPPRVQEGIRSLEQPTDGVVVASWIAHYLRGAASRLHPASASS